MASRLRPGGDHVLVIPLGVGEHLQRDAVGEREQQRDDGADLEAGLDHALGLLGAQDLGDVRSGAVEELRHLALDLGVAATGGEQVKEQNPESGVVLYRVLEVRNQDLEQLVGRRRIAERLVHPRDPVLGVAPHHLDQQGLLRAEVVVEEPAADARLAGDVLEGRP